MVLNPMLNLRLSNTQPGFTQTIDSLPKQMVSVLHFKLQKRAWIGRVLCRILKSFKPLRNAWVERNCGHIVGNQRVMV